MSKKEQTKTAAEMLEAAIAESETPPTPSGFKAPTKRKRQSLEELQTLLFRTGVHKRFPRRLPFVHSDVTTNEEKGQWSLLYTQPDILPHFSFKVLEKDGVVCALVEAADVPITMLMPTPTNGRERDEFRNNLRGVLMASHERRLAKAARLETMKPEDSDSEDSPYVDDDSVNSEHDEDEGYSAEARRVMEFVKLQHIADRRKQKAKRLRRAQYQTILHKIMGEGGYHSVLTCMTNALELRLRRLEEYIDLRRAKDMADLGQFVGTVFKQLNERE
jgi:hypothetical protein